MILYHGSDHIIEKPVFGEGKSYNDYGRGFYCTEHVIISGCHAVVLPSCIAKALEPKQS